MPDQIVHSRPGHGLLCIWPITTATYDRDALIQQATEALEAGELDWLGGVPGMPLPGPATWRVVDGADLDGWEWWDGQLLVATMPGRPAETAAAA